MSRARATVGAVRRLRDEVARFLRAAGVARGDGVLVACSHGPDSLALADAVGALRGRLGLGTVTLVYVDHGLRPAAARAEGAAVRAFAAELEVAARVVAVALDRRRGGGLEEAARAARYAALDAAAAELGARFVLLGHTASDQAETVLARLLRGAGPVGLAGIPPARGRYLRPLLALDRAAICAYVAARGLAPSHDAMNDDPAFLRNRVRHTLLPALRRENPAADDALRRAASACREVADALDWAAGEAAERVTLRRAPGAARVDAAKLAALPAAVAKRLVARLAAELGGSLEASHLEAIVQLAATRSARGGAARALPGLSVRREYGDLVVEATRPSHAAPPPGIQVDVMGDDGPYVVRSWRPGDRMRPASLRGRSRKLQDLFSDRKIPRPARARAVVVARQRDGEIVWAEHVGPAFGSKVQVSLTMVDPPAINEGSLRPDA